MEAEDAELLFQPLETNTLKAKPRSGVVRTSNRALAHSYDPRPRSYKLLSNCETLGHEQIRQIQKKNYLKLQKENKERIERFKMRDLEFELL